MLGWVLSVSAPWSRWRRRSKRPCDGRIEPVGCRTGWVVRGGSIW